MIPNQDHVVTRGKGHVVCNLHSRVARRSVPHRWLAAGARSVFLMASALHCSSAREVQPAGRHLLLLMK